MRRVRFTAAAIATAMLAGALALPAPRPARAEGRPMGEADPKAAAIAKELTDAMGGQKAWDDLPYFRFDFVIVRDGKEVARFRHWWDKKHGRERVEGPDDKGRIVTAIFSLADKKGKTFTDGLLDTDSTNIANIIQMGYERWVNDTYWVMMPFKLRDPGTHLKYDREETGKDGTPYDVLELTFDKGVGLTSDDHYWLFVNRKTHLIDKWEYVLTGQKPPPQVVHWESWTQIGPIRLSLLRRFEGKPVMLRFENVATPATMDESVFSYSHIRD
ncbi:MAG: DUF6503 family protein [Hyphomicrobiales bacterium]